MAGYIGTKAALLSTTTASVGGDSTVGGDLTVDTNTLHVDSANNRVGVGTSSPSANLDVASSNATIHLTDTDDTTYAVIRNNGGTFTIASDEGQSATNSSINFRVDGSEAMRIDSSGNLLVGTTTPEIRSQSSIEGLAYRTGNSLDVSTTSGLTANFNRMSTDGDIVSFRKDGSTEGRIGFGNNYVYYTGAGAGLMMRASDIIPTNGGGTPSDNTEDLGDGLYRFDDIFATNGTIQTSDRNEKQDIVALTATEMLVAARISAMFKTFRWIDRVADNPNARTHTGIIAQDVQQAFTDEGLDAGDYSLFVSTTWDDENGNSQTRMGIRYPELLSFIAAYNEQRFTDIEARLTALEAV